MKLLALIISLISNPLVLAAPIVFALVFKTSNDFSYSLIWTAISLIFTSSIGIYVFWGVKRGLFTNMDISVRSERKPAFVFAGVIALIYLALILFVNGPKIIIFTLVTLLLGVFVTSAINTKTKASMHLAVFSAFALVYGLFFGGQYWLFAIFAPIVAWSRIVLKRHKPIETVVGFFIGAILVIFLRFIVEYI